MYGELEWSLRSANLEKVTRLVRALSVVSEVE
jgi:hypothetical protein